MADYVVPRDEYTALLDCLGSLKHIVYLKELGIEPSPSIYDAAAEHVHAMNKVHGLE